MKKSFFLVLLITVLFSPNLFGANLDEPAKPKVPTIKEEINNGYIYANVIKSTKEPYEYDKQVSNEVNKLLLAKSSDAFFVGFWVSVLRQHYMLRIVYNGTDPQSYRINHNYYISMFNDYKGKVGLSKDDICSVILFLPGEYDACTTPN